MNNGYIVATAVISP